MALLVSDDHLNANDVLDGLHIARERTEVETVLFLCLFSTVHLGLLPRESFDQLDTALPLPLQIKLDNIRCHNGYHTNYNHVT